MYSGMGDLIGGISIANSLDVETLKQKVEKQEKEIADLKQRLKALEAVVLEMGTVVLDQEYIENSEECEHEKIFYVRIGHGRASR